MAPGKHCGVRGRPRPGGPRPPAQWAVSRGGGQPRRQAEALGPQDKAVQVDRAGPVTTVILNRPAVRNAVDAPTAAALAEAFADFDADSDAAVAVLFGAGGTFCAGADLKAMGTDRGNRTAEDGNGPMGPTRMRLSKPVIAAVAGHAVAGGLELALWCDLRVVEENAVFGVFCRRWGVPLIDGGTVRLPQIVGHGPGPGHDPDRARRAGRRGLRDGTGHAARARRPRPGRRPSSSPGRSRPCRRSACAATARRRWKARRWSSARRWRTSSGTARRR